MQVIVMPGPFIQMGQPRTEAAFMYPEKTAEAFNLPPIEVIRGVTIKGRLVDTCGRSADGGPQTLGPGRESGTAMVFA